MRLLILAAGAALLLAACGDDNQAENTQNADQALTAESIVANDITAIDAVTGEAANMAADVDIEFTNEMLAAPGGNTAARKEQAQRSRSSGQRGDSPARRRSAASPPASQSAAEPAANTTE